MIYVTAVYGNIVYKSRGLTLAHQISGNPIIHECDLSDLGNSASLRTLCIVTDPLVTSAWSSVVRLDRISIGWNLSQVLSHAAKQNDDWLSKAPIPIYHQRLYYSGLATQPLSVCTIWYTIYRTIAEGIHPDPNEHVENIVRKQVEGNRPNPDKSILQMLIWCGNHLPVVINQSPY